MTPKPNEHLSPFYVKKKMCCLTGSRLRSQPEVALRFHRVVFASEALVGAAAPPGPSAPTGRASGGRPRA